MEQLAKQMNLSVSRIGQIEKAALRKLKNNEKVCNLHDEVYGYESQYAYHMSLKHCLDHNTSTVEELVFKRIAMEEKQKRIQNDIDDFFTNLRKQISG